MHVHAMKIYLYIGYNAYVLIGGTTAVHDYIINTCIFKAFLIINLFRSFAIQCRVH